MPGGIALFLFVKGTAASRAEKLVADGQVAATLDTLERLVDVPELGTIVVVTASQDVAERAAALGAVVEMDSLHEDFHFGQRLAHLAEKHPADHILYVGGGSGVLMRAEDWRALAARVLSVRDTVISNNFFSCDFAAWTPGEAIAQITPPELDNDLAFRLSRQAGLSATTLPKNAATQLDIDTPTDLMTASLHPAVGPRLRALLDSGPINPNRADRVRSIISSPRGNMLIAGRVSAAMMFFLEQSTPCQWRVFSEERGMRASGREARGEVRSVLGYILDTVGVGAFFQMLGKVTDGAVLDSRILFAHRGLHPGRSDRFNSDLLAAEEIGDSFVRSFTAAARQAGIPILLGGHSLVSGGMYTLGEVRYPLE
ncbi:MAG: hypothetical protein M1132_03605 [Chloroflexi bacterium]|nr:hypothetical protein [Chloroflexota bacterium]